jgi:hypothetical protein
MAISERTRKLLWGKAGNRCAICRRELAISGAGSERDSIVGEECHIVARELDGPRGVSDLTEQQRDEYENIILLCNIHHKQIDDQVASFPAERLKGIKLHHERWVRASLDLLNSQTLSGDGQLGDNELLAISTLDHLTAGDVYKACKESDGSVIEILAAPTGHVAKNDSFLGHGLGFSITNNTRFSIRVNRILIDVLSTDRLLNVELVAPTGIGGGAERHVYWCELLPDVGMFECRYISDMYDYVKILGNDLEYFEIYLVDRDFENRLYTIQVHIDFTFGTNRHSVTLEPVSLAFIEDWCAEFKPEQS